MYFSCNLGFIIILLLLFGCFYFKKPSQFSSSIACMIL